jgi:zinc transport system substrate-binding protein
MLMLLVLSGCSVHEEPAAAGIGVLVSIVPQKYFAERIAGDLIQVSVLIPPGASPAAHELSPAEMREVARSDIWFSIGVPSERRWLGDFQALYPELLIVDTGMSIQRLPIGRYGLPGTEDHHNHNSHHDHDHGSGNDDPHIWLSPELVKGQAEVMARTLAAADPDNAAIYTENLALFLEDISALQQDIQGILAEQGSGGAFVVFHPAWGYFADEFDLVQIPIEIAGSEPSPSEMAAIVDHVSGLGVAAVFVSPQFSTSSAEAVAAEIGASLVVIDPLSEQWLENMRLVAGELASAVR